MQQVFADVACTVCACLCDDLRVTVEDGRITSCQGACPLAEPWFFGQEGHFPPMASIEGREVPLETALSRAAELLSAASSPLVYGLARSTTEGQRAAVALAESIGATIDTTASICHAPSVVAVQQVGESTCTLGEIRNRANLVVFWASNPVVSHPRHFERYSLLPEGRYVPRGRRDRTLVVADVRRTPSTDAADVFLQIQPGRDFEALTTLRALVRGASLEPGAVTGADPELLQELAQKMKTCAYGVIFFGYEIGQQNVEALLLLVRDLNEHTRFAARRMRVPGDVTGADIVLTWQTGYPFSVNLARGYPRYNPGEFSAHEMLERGEVDAALFVGSEAIPRLADAAVAHLRRIPTIVLDYPPVLTPITPTIRFTTAVYGIHRPGTAYRMDGVPVPLRPVLPSRYPSDQDVLEQIGARLGAPSRGRS
jgi:formylmethanofuran dehydrogenase subunit B